jgi:DNA processing protein
MSAAPATAAESGPATACGRCLRRAWLIGALADHLERVSREDALDATLGLSDAAVIAALAPAGPSRRRVRSGYERFDTGWAAAATRAAGLEAVCRHDDAYPTPLHDLAGPPAVLFVSSRQRLRELSAEPVVALVGARRASPYGLRIARALGRGLSAARVTVASGMALGVDSAAHAGALEAGARTIAVLGGGADVAYPRTKRALHGRLLRESVVVSELPPGASVRRWSFPARNRTIAALARVTVVVEAAERSGALITARVARELGRDVAAVPGEATARLAAGTNALIRDGAHLVTSAQDVLDLACGVGARSPPAMPDPATLEPRLREVFAAVQAGQDSPGALAATREEARDVLAALAELELRGFLRRRRDGRYEPCG